jgi:hypothetical protein
MSSGMAWFRWHHGSVNDPKFGLVARRARVTVAAVIATWACLLEAASANEPRGTLGAIDFEALDYQLGLEDGDAERIVAAMTDRGLIEQGAIAAWEKRQPKREREQDSSSERVRAFRERQRQQQPGNASETPSNASDDQETPRGEESRGDKRREEKTSSLRSSGGAGQQAGAADKPPKPAPLGSRLPEDWQPDAELLDWTTAQGLTDVEASREAAKFRDYWMAKAGAAGRKADWTATWRNWVRKAIEDKSRFGLRGQPMSRQAQAELLGKAAADEWLRQEGF